MWTLLTLAILLFTGALPAVAQTAVADDPRALEAYVGSYAFESGPSIRVMLQGDALTVDGLGPKARMTPNGSRVFDVVGDRKARLEFTPGPDGRQLRVTVREQSASRSGERIVVSPDLLGTYVGTYVLSDSLSMVVTLEGGMLHAQGTGRSKHPLFAESPTRFFVQDYKTEDVASLEFDAETKGAFVTIRQAGFEQKVFRR